MLSLSIVSPDRLIANLAARGRLSAAEPEGRWRRPAGMVTISDSQSEAPAARIQMAKGKKKLEVIHLVCEETGDQNYTLRRKTGGEKLKVKKYSPRLRKHTVHNEKRK